MAQSRSLPLPQSAQYAYGGVENGAGVADGGSGLQGRAAWETGHRHGATHCLGNHVEGLVVGVGSGQAETLDPGHDNTGIHFFEHVIAQSQPFHRAGGHVLGYYVSLPYHVQEHGLAFLAPEVEGHAPLVQVQHDEVEAVHARNVRSAAPAWVAVLWLLNLDNVGS